MWLQGRQAADAKASLRFAFPASAWAMSGTSTSRGLRSTARLAATSASVPRYGSCSSQGASWASLRLWARLCRLLTWCQARHVSSLSAYVASRCAQGVYRLVKSSSRSLALQLVRPRCRGSACSGICALPRSAAFAAGEGYVGIVKLVDPGAGGFLENC